MVSPAYNVATLLQTGGLGTMGSTIFVGKDPAMKTATITCYDFGSATPPNPKFNRNEPRVQIIVAGNVNDYNGAYTKAKQIKDNLLGRDNITIGTDIYFGFRIVSDIASLGYDANNRPMFSVVFKFYTDGADEGNRVSL
jgi:hypothetical protein